MLAKVTVAQFGCYFLKQNGKAILHKILSILTGGSLIAICKSYL